MFTRLFTLSILTLFALAGCNQDFGKVSEGPYVDGKKHGHWVLRGVYGQVSEGPFVDGKKHGDWKERDMSGNVSYGPYVDGKKHGMWSRRAYGDHFIGPYVNGKKHGEWIRHFADGREFGPYVNGKKHGKWTMHLEDGRKSFVEWSAGEKVDRRRLEVEEVAEERSNDCSAISYWDDELQDIQYDDETSCRGPVVNGKAHGNWLISGKNPDGSTYVHMGPYVDGVRHGDWSIGRGRFYDSRSEEGSYVDGKRHGHWVFSDANGVCFYENYSTGDHGRCD